MTVGVGLALALAGCAPESSERSGETGSVVGPGPSATSVESRGVESDNTPEVVEAADRFLETLSAAERERVLHDVDDPALREWVYFPTAEERNGLALGDLSSSQRSEALRLADAVLSDSGFAQMEQILAAETALGIRNNDRNANAGRYFVSLFGEPDESGRFSVQFNGHHLAVNHTYEDGRVSPTPAFTGVDPTRVTIDGRVVRPMGPETAAITALAEALGEEGLTAARIEPIDDVLVGDGSSDAYPEQEGTLVSDLTDPQRERVIDVLRAWVRDTDEGAAARLLDEYIEDFSQTTVAWAGSADPDQPGSYLRLAGPRLWLEFSNVGRFDNGDNHYHSVWRDRSSDYLG